MHFIVKSHLSCKYWVAFYFAFTSLKYKTSSDNQIDTRVIQWFKEGFQFNKVASSLRVEAYKNWMEYWRQNKGAN
jgi:hypothetical protein